MCAPRTKRVSAGAALLALGVVFGDIGTSPLYAFETALGAARGTGALPFDASVGTASLIFWVLTWVVFIKYALLVMRVNYHGEGGIFALFALLRETQFFQKRWVGPASVALMVLGAALLFGDGAITPAISVLSAVEGLEAIDPALASWAVPVSIGILAALFLAQRFGTGRLGWIFGPIMLLWFLALAVSGAWAVWQTPEVLAALHPGHGLNLLWHGGPKAWMVVGAVVLAVTGAEALYADLAHFGRGAILAAWSFVVYPSLLLNYLGQAALSLRNPVAAESSNLFFLMFPDGWCRPAMVLLATLATIVASQALISGVFSLASQAVDLGYLPRFHIRHTSRTARGQTYIPLVNAALGLACLGLVFGFRSSANLAGAYGVAVTGAMIITSVAYVLVLWQVRRHSGWLVGGLLLLLLAVDLPLFLASLGKLAQGGIAPVLLAGLAAGMMLSWRKGRDLVHQAMKIGAVSVAELARRMGSGEFRTTPGTEVFIVRKPLPENAIACILEKNRRVKALSERVVILLLETGWSRPMDAVEAVELEEAGGGLWVIHSRHGYMVEPDVPLILRQASAQSPGRFPFDENDTFYVTSQEIILTCPRRVLPPWQRHLFAFMSRNALPGPNYLNIPGDRLIVYNWLLRL